MTTKGGTMTKRVRKHRHRKRETCDLCADKIRTESSAEQDADREMLGDDADYFDTGRIGNK